MSARSVGTRGFTLAELMIVIAILGIMAAFVGLAWRPPKPKVDETPILRARHEAIQRGRPVRFQVVVGAVTIAAVALPDGSVIGADTLRVDPLSGVPAAGQVHD